MRTKTKTKMSNKGQMQLLQSAGMQFVVIIVSLAIGAYVVVKIGATFTVHSVEANITATGLTALETLVEWLPIIAVVIAGGIALFLLMRFLGGQK